MVFNQNRDYHRTLEEYSNDTLVRFDIELLNTKVLPDFPSGSSINYHHGKFYLVGDDSTTLLVLDRNYDEITSLQLFDYPEKRIPKHEKTDLEASAFIRFKEQTHLLLMGSASRKRREKIILIPFTEHGLHTTDIQKINDDIFIDRLRELGVDEINIEGLTSTGEHLLIGNRGNRKNMNNQVIITLLDFWKNQSQADLKILPIEITVQTDEMLGLSEMCYLDTLDMLFMTFSCEHTNNAYDDGEIGDSYLGWVGDVKNKIRRHTLPVDDLINLSDIHADFKTEKIEGICIEPPEDDHLRVHLVSDNDNGESKLFTLGMKIVD